MNEILATFGIDWRLLLVQAVNFGILLAALWYLLYGPVMRTLRARQEKIAQGVHDAEAAARERDAVQQQKDETLSEASKEAEQIVEAGRERARQQESQMLDQARQRHEQLVYEGQQRAEEVQQRAIEQSREEIGRWAVQTAEKVLRERRQSTSGSGEA